MVEFVAALTKPSRDQKFWGSLLTSMELGGFPTYSKGDNRGKPLGGILHCQDSCGSGSVYGEGFSIRLPETRSLINNNF